MREHWWFRGRILACHAGGPGSIPGQCRVSLFCFSSPLTASGPSHFKYWLSFASHWWKSLSLRWLSQKANFQHQPSILSWTWTSTFDILPKIHKPGNLGRPIVSACNCPTEIITTYLDGITTPLVQSLLSYVKDTNHMLRITDFFRERPTMFHYVFFMDVKSLRPPWLESYASSFQRAPVVQW